MWLNVKPDKRETTRLEDIRKAGKEPLWPDLQLRYLFDLLLEVGPITSTEMGASVISWQEVGAYCNVIGFDIRPWEAKILRTASSEYLTQMRIASKENCPPPGTVVDNDPYKMAKHIKSTLRG